MNNENQNDNTIKNLLIVQYQNNITSFPKKEISDVFIPKSTAELLTFVQNANKEGKDFYAFSTGKNWGLGSKQPVIENSAVVNLKELNQIIDVNEKYRYAIIEPGVTQQQLSDFLQQNFPHLKFPVTGSATSTSIIGNLAERGAGAFGHKNEMIVAMEVLFPNGKYIKTGNWHNFENNNPLAFHYAKGFGPDLRGLFIQSNFGIITKMVIRLQPLLKGTILVIKFNEESLKEITNRLRYLHEKKLLDDGIVITNLNDPRTANKRSYHYTGQWLAVCSLSGERRITNAKKSLISKKLKSVTKDFFFIGVSSNQFSFKKSTLLPYLLGLIEKNKWLNRLFKNINLKSGETLEELLIRFSILKNFYKGIPTNYSIETMAAMNDTILKDHDLDNSSILGLVVSLPAVPFDGEALLEVSQIVNDISQKWHVQPFHNFASIDELTFEGFYRIYFDRMDTKEVEVAQSWRKDLNQALLEKHYFPYRVDNESMKDFIKKDSNYWKTINRLKTVFDENNIYARGKYNLQD